MEPSSLSPILSLGSGFALVVFLIGTLVNNQIALRRENKAKDQQLVEREAAWVVERAELRAACRLEVAELRAQCRLEIAEAKADMLDQAKFQRERIVELEQEISRLRHGDGP